MASIADLICDNHTYEIDCYHGITWYTSNSQEADEFRKKSLEQPEKYVFVSDECVAFGWIEGRQVVWSCEKCMDHFTRCEQWLLAHEEVVRKFLKAYGDERLAAAQRLAAIE